jgi:hypothetical protein
MLTFEQAKERITKLINELGAQADDEWVVVPEDTIERKWGWVFGYQSSRYLETGKISYALAGNAPYIVNKYTGEIKATGTALPLEQYLKEYEAELDSGAI